MSSLRLSVLFFAIFASQLAVADPEPTLYLSCTGTADDVPGETFRLQVGVLEGRQSVFHLSPPHADRSAIGEIIGTKDLVATSPFNRGLLTYRLHRRASMRNFAIKGESVSLPIFEEGLGEDEGILLLDPVQNTATLNSEFGLIRFTCS